MITQLKKGALEMCVLCILSRSDMYGYELAATISRTIAVTEGTIYPLLKRIRDENYVRTYIRESTGGPARRYYTLTDEGKRYSRELLTQWRLFVDAVNLIVKEDQVNE